MDSFDSIASAAMGALAKIWTSALTPAPAPPPAIVVGTLVFAVLVVVVTPVWRVARHLVTIAHEGAHGVAALLSGRRLAGIRLHSDTSGLTLSRGRPRGAGMVLTSFAGYVGPGLIGLGAAWLLSHGYAMGVLWSLTALLALLLLQIRNWFGLWSVLVTGTILVVVSWYAPPSAQTTAAYAVTWFLLLGSVKPVFELQSQRRRGRARDSDADQLGRITPLPALVWIGAFGVVTVGCAVFGGWLLLGAS
ncbi:M50 family metallopeptidase [Microbacterium betulae]|uniref:M50 family metallopeptidase n=1 Tax=Microbacterium betulae TaxID=2981139 RepID=A0AA97FF56_9MICO|nr:M50 family metallopeptidase [Microbacterium sp. AB]WOF21483.1 M50 family metallopeptidase [Microbacterium sp. AB]